MKSGVVVIGAGLAGMIAAWSAARHGAEIFLLDRGPIGTGTNSSLANGVFAGPTPLYSEAHYIRDTLEAGRFINSQPFVKLVAGKIPEAIQLMRSFGLTLQEAKERYYLRSTQSGMIPGIGMVRRLKKELQETSGIHLLTGCCATEILHGAHRVEGVKCIDWAGESFSIGSQAVVLAAGGAAAIYLRNDNQKKILGQGYYLAARAGLSLRDMEFVQFFPLVIAEERLPSLIVYPPYPQESRLVNSFGDDLIRKYNFGDINHAITKRRDELSACLYKEETAGGRIYMDFRRVPDHLWESHPLSILKRMKFDFRAKKVAVSPAAHFFMGGLRIRENAETDMDGLYACGEILWGLHGANRMGDNALSECAVTGIIAGVNSALSGSASPRAGYCREAPRKISEKPAASGVSENGSSRNPLAKIRKTAWESAGVVRSGKGMRAGLAKLADIRREIEAAPVCPAGGITRMDAESALFTLEAILRAGLGREESRGSFVREDFPMEEDEWRKNSRTRYDGETKRFSTDFVLNPLFSEGLPKKDR